MTCDLYYDSSIRLKPPKPVFCLPGGFVFAAYPARIAQFVDRAEEIGEIDFAGSGFVSKRRVGHLHMRDLRKLALDRLRQIAFHDLHVIDVVLKKEIVRSDGADDLDRLGRVAQKEVRDVASVDRFDQQADAGRFELRRGALKIPDERGAHVGRVGAGRRHAGEAIELRAAERRGVVNRAIDAFVEFPHPIRMTGNPAFAGLPVPGRQVVQHLREPVVGERLLERGLVVFVREQNSTPLNPACAAAETARGTAAR